MLKIPQINRNNFYNSPKSYNFGTIQCVKNNATKPITQTNLANFAPLRAYALPFLGNQKHTISPDTLYLKIQSQASNVTQRQVEVMFNNIDEILKSRGISAGKEDILFTMGALTQYANLDGLKKLNEQISNRTNGTYNLYSQGTPNSLANTLYYLSNSKKIFPYPENKEKTVFMLDGLGMQTLEHKAKKNSLDDFNYSHLEFVYPIGWREGINMFNQGKDYKNFELKTADIIERALAKNNYFPDALDDVLTEDVENVAKKFGIKDVKYVTPLAGNESFDFKDIANNLNSKTPTRKEVRAICMGIGEYCQEKYGKTKEYWTNLTAQYFYDNFIYYSPKAISQKLKTIHKEIEKNLPKGKTMDDVYYLLPTIGKSYNYIAYQYALVNNVSSEKFIFGDTETAEDDYSGKVFVYLDDISASGMSVLVEVGGLNYTGLNEVKKNDIEGKNPTGGIENQYMIATLYSTPLAKEKTGREIEKRERYNLDGEKIKDIQIATNTGAEGEFVKQIKMSDDLSKIDTLFHDETNGMGGFSGVGTKTIFPYMTPDTNAPILKFLAEKFIPRAAIKTDLNPYTEELNVRYLIAKNFENPALQREAQVMSQ